MNAGLVDRILADRDEATRRKAIADTTALLEQQDLVQARTILDKRVRQVEAAIVAWLRTLAAEPGSSHARAGAFARIIRGIEAGEHRKAGT